MAQDFSKVILDIKKNDMAFNSTMIRSAVWAEGKDFQKITDDLSNETKQNTSNIPSEWVTKQN